MGFSLPYPFPMSYRHRGSGKVALKKRLEKSHGKQVRQGGRNPGPGVLVFAIAWICPFRPAPARGHRNPEVTVMDPE